MGIQELAVVPHCPGAYGNPRSRDSAASECMHDRSAELSRRGSVKQAWGPSVRILEPSWIRLGAVLGRLWDDGSTELSRKGLVEPCWGHLDGSWGCLGTVLGRAWDVLGSHQALLGLS